MPFHVWTPDVYEGAPTPVTAFLSGVEDRRVRRSSPASSTWRFRTSTSTGSIVLAVVSALSMIVGNIAALTQNNVKRMLAYSSIAHAGYAMLGVVALERDGPSAASSIYSLVYRLREPRHLGDGPDAAPHGLRRRERH